MYVYFFLYLCTLYVFVSLSRLHTLVWHNTMQNMRKSVRIVLFASLCILLLGSCVTRKKLTYFQGVDAVLLDSINRHYHPVTEPTAWPGDMLTISVSALDAEAAAPYNLPAVVYSDPKSTQLSTTPAMQRYIVAPDGTIDFPILGLLQVRGLTQSGIKQMLEERLSLQLSDPEVVVSILNQTVSVLGEVSRPGRYALSNGRLTLPELLALAGDLTVYGKRDNVLIAREENGKLEYGRVNLNQADVFTSPYYFLRPHDVVYIAPNSVRAIQSQNVSLWLSMVSTVASAATVIVTVVNAANSASAASANSNAK